MSSEIDRAIECLTIGRRLSSSSLSDEFLNTLAMEFSLRIDSKAIAPSKCAHAMCLSSANGYSPVVQMLSKRSKNEFNKAYTFDEPLARAIRGWLKGKKDNDEIKKRRCNESAKYLILAGANIYEPEKYLKTKLTPYQRLENDNSEEARQFLEELTGNGSGVSGKRSPEISSHDIAESKSSDPAKKKRRRG